MSMLPYTSDQDLAEEHNRQFQTKHPQIDSGITLSDLIRLKDDLIDLFLNREQDLNNEYEYGQIYTVAHAWVLFERLVYKNIVTQSNQRKYIAACLSISIKLIETLDQKTSNLLDNDLK